MASAQGQRLDTHRSGLYLHRLQGQDHTTGQGESMTTMIYIRKATDRYNETTGFKRLAFTNAEAIGRQVEWMLDEIKRDKGTPEEWNDNGGDEWDVEPAFAQGCQLNELMTRHMKPLIKAYPYRGKNTKVEGPLGYVRGTRPSMPYPPSDEKHSVREVSWFSTEFGGDQQEEAQQLYHRNIETYDEAIEFMKANEPVAPLMWKYNTTALTGAGYSHTIHIIPYLGVDTYFNADNFDGVNQTMGDILAQEAEEEHKQWLAYTKTDAYKEELEANAQAEADLRTAMGEGGYTSYARNDNGTITMWR